MIDRCSTAAPSPGTRQRVPFARGASRPAGRPQARLTPPAGHPSSSGFATPSRRIRAQPRCRTPTRRAPPAASARKSNARGSRRNHTFQSRPWRASHKDAPRTSRPMKGEQLRPPSSCTKSSINLRGIVGLKRRSRAAFSEISLFLLRAFRSGGVAVLLPTFCCGWGPVLTGLYCS